ncbi:hypothetical protein K402DRAFT_157884 [Aulographum hederae CBS 113979]|uniref:Uncharacterized protein n=1 Tax=Aulographum hederae CBS 113979 TaxID=1176131 RepID=A0A6G1GSX0_9PEZI|nr:hypothetical protein K402DRAFT_157884 [Aulographum hederae CBS 113979]
MVCKGRTFLPFAFASCCMLSFSLAAVEANGILRSGRMQKLLLAIQRRRHVGQRDDIFEGVESGETVTGPARGLLRTRPFADGTAQLRQRKDAGSD